MARRTLLKREHSPKEYGYSVDGLYSATIQRFNDDAGMQYLYCTLCGVESGEESDRKMHGEKEYHQRGMIILGELGILGMPRMEE